MNRKKDGKVGRTEKKAGKKVKYIKVRYNNGVSLSTITYLLTSYKTELNQVTKSGDFYLF